MVRLTPLVAGFLEVRAGRERRSPAEVARMILEDALVASEKAVEGWGKLDEAMRASRGGQVEPVAVPQALPVREATKVVASPPPSSPATHEFAQSMKAPAGECWCGRRRGHEVHKVVPA